MLSPGGLPEVPCAKCQRRVAGLPWGELCPECRAERSARASRLANRISLAATALTAAYVALRMPTIQRRGSTVPWRSWLPTSSCGGSSAASPWRR